MAGQAQWQEPMAFEDVAVLLSRAEWDALTEGQRELYRDVVSDTYELLTSLGYPGPKPDVLHRLERGEEPWVCSSPGHTESWLEEPSSDWWPRSSGCQGLETLCPGWSTLWCLQDRNFQKKFGCHKGRSEVPSEADSGVGSQTQPWSVKEEVEDKPELMEDLTHRKTFPLHSMMEQQRLHPWEQLWDGPGQRNHRNAQNHRQSLGEATLLPGTRALRVEELRAAAAKDHGYCLRSEPGTPCAPQPCSLWEHNYCQQLQAEGSHEAGGATRRRSKSGRNRKAGRKREVSSFRAVRRQLASCRCRWRRTFRRAREILRRYQPYWRLGFPWRDRSSSSGGAAQGTNPGDVFRNVLKAIRYILDSMCQKLELQGVPQGKTIWPIIIQIDNLTEMKKL
ncbi:uncharacterized protein LOC118695239 [Molothrus ater]|uniref:uncharacterized protein LOC118695239 n=1 Tax=Molothrus ater TaxID=84834 RepID=UPI0017485143|nr:uncharacterized protein LOC118695239 [Molothrus ater]